MKQVQTCLEYSGENPDDYPNFYIAFTGIGEPSIVKEKIGTGIKLIQEKYNNVQVNIATTGFDSTCFDYWNKMDLPIRTLQLPYYSCDEDKMKFIMANLPEGYDLGRNIAEAIQYKNSHSLCRVKVNFVVMEGVNSSDEEIERMLVYLEPFKKDIIIKISYLNYTKKCQEYNLCSPNQDRMLEIIEKIQSAGFDCYVFGTKSNTELGCGQLVQNYISQEDVKDNKKLSKRYVY